MTVYTIFLNVFLGPKHILKHIVTHSDVFLAWTCFFFSPFPLSRLKYSLSM